MKFSKRLNHQERILTIVGSVLLIVNLLLNPCYAQQRVALPDEWWCQPTWSPDSRLIAVQSPPPTKVPFKGKDGETHYGYTEPPDRKTLILQAKDYQVLASIDQAIWPTWSPNGKFLAAETWDKNDFHHFVAVYDAASGSRLKKFNVDLPSSFAWAPDSQKLLISQRKAISICDLENKIDSQLPTEDGECYWSHPVWSPNGDLVAAYANLPYKLKSSNRIKIWDARSRVCRRSIDVASGIGTLRWSKDGQTFLYREPESIKVIDTASGDTTKTIKTDECVSFAYSPKGGYLAFRDRDRLHILDSGSLTEKLTMQGPKSGFFSFDWSPDERFTLIDGRETVAVCDSTTGTDDDADKKEAEILARLESNVDLRKPADRREQSFIWLLDLSGREIAQPKYFPVRPFSEELSAVTSGHSGFIDVDGNVAIPIQFETCRSFSEGLAWASVWTHDNGYIDHKGNWVIRNKDFQQGNEFSEGLAAVLVRINSGEVGDGRNRSQNLPSLWGFIAKDGRIVIAPKYSVAEAFHEGRAAVKVDNNWSFIDQNGSAIGDQYDEIGHFSESFAPVCSNGKWGFIDPNGKLAIPQKFGHVRSFAYGMATVKEGAKFGFIDKSGSMIIAPQYIDARDFSQGLCAVRVDSGKWGFIDRTGKFAIAPTFDDAQSFSSGLACVSSGSRYGFIDQSGRYVVQPKYDFAQSYSSNRAVVMCKNWNHPFMRGLLMSAHLKGLSVHKDPTSPTGVYIPLNLHDALKELDEMLPPTAKQDISIIEKSEMINYHHGFGTWLRNNWGLWKGLRLATYFRSTGTNHPDDMSGMILDSYWTKVHGEIK